MVVVYERQQRFRQEAANELISGFLQAFAAVGTCSVRPLLVREMLGENRSCCASGMKCEESDPMVFYQHSSAKIGEVSRMKLFCVDVR